MHKLEELPNKRIDAASAFKLNVAAHIPMFSVTTKFVPKSLQRFRFDEATTLCALAGLVYNKRVLIAGAYGTGKSSHIEQICSRLN